MDYSYTSYGAQGGSGGGGFMDNPTQSASQGSPSGRGNYSKDTLRPVTIKQILNAHQPHPDADFSVDGSPLTQLTFIGQVRNISTQATNMTYRLDDGTGVIDVKQWIDPESTTLGGHENNTVINGKPALKENSYVRVLGKLKAFNNRRHVGAHVLRPVTDLNEVAYHLLQAAYVHLYMLRGPPNGEQQEGVKQESAHNVGSGNDGMQGAHVTQGAGDDKLISMNAMEKKVYQVLKDTAQSNEGLHYQLIASEANMTPNDVLRCTDRLSQVGIIYSTLDDNTFAVADY